MNATSLTNEVKRQIKNFNDGCAHELPETIEQVKLALNDRGSDGKAFVISDKSIRQKLKYHYEKAVAAILRLLVKQEYFAKLRSSGIREIRKAADVLECQLTAGGAFPGATLIYFICL